MSLSYVLANWKMYPTPAAAAALLSGVQDRLREDARAHALPAVIVCPPTIALMSLREAIDPPLVRLGAQNCHWEASGPYTGETSPAALAGVVDYVMVGHSERRRSGETDEHVARKVAAVVAHGMTPILFVGEDEPSDQGARDVEERLDRGVANVDLARERVLVVYEPAWAIGADEPAAAEHVARVAARLKERLRDRGAQRPAIIYGGTVNAANVDRFVAIEALDGVGATRGTLDEDGFVTIVRSVARGHAEATGG